MPIYVLLSQVTDRGAKTIVDRPERIQEVNREIEAFGVRVLHQYATLGQYDFVNIVEAPDPATIARMSAELGARGTLKVQTLAALPVDEFIAKIRGK